MMVGHPNDREFLIGHEAGVRQGRFEGAFTVLVALAALYAIFSVAWAR